MLQTGWFGSGWGSAWRWAGIFLVSLLVGIVHGWLDAPAGGVVTRARLFAAMGASVQSVWPLLREAERDRCAAAHDLPDLSVTSPGERFVLVHEVMRPGGNGRFGAEQTVAPYEVISYWSRLCEVLEDSLKIAPPRLREWAVEGRSAADWLTVRRQALLAIDALPAGWRHGPLPDRPATLAELTVTARAVTAYFAEDLLILRPEARGVRCWLKGARQRLDLESCQFAFAAGSWQPVPRSGWIGRPADGAAASAIRWFHPVAGIRTATVSWAAPGVLRLSLRDPAAGGAGWLPTAHAEEGPVSGPAGSGEDLAGKTERGRRQVRLSAAPGSRWLEARSRRPVTSPSSPLPEADEPGGGGPMVGRDDDPSGDISSRNFRALAENRNSIGNDDSLSSRRIPNPPGAVMPRVGRLPVLSVRADARRSDATTMVGSTAVAGGGGDGPDLDGEDLAGDGSSGGAVELERDPMLAEAAAPTDSELASDRAAAWGPAAGVPVPARPSPARRPAVTIGRAVSPAPPSPRGAAHSVAPAAPPFAAAEQVPEPSGWRWGRVVEVGTGRPLAGAALIVDGRPITADERGYFLLDEAQRDQLLAITAYQEGYQPLTLKHRAGFAAQGPRLGLRPVLATLQGRVLDPAGMPVGGARVLVGQRTTLTDAAGRYFLPGLRPSYQQVLIETADGQGCIETVYVDPNGSRHDFSVGSVAGPARETDAAAAPGGPGGARRESWQQPGTAEFLADDWNAAEL